MRKLIIYFIIFLNLPVVTTAGIKVIGEPQKLVGGAGLYFMQPRWSPDGAYIAFTGAQYQGLWVIQRDGTNLQQLTDELAAGFGFAWSYDSKAIVTRVAKYEDKYRYNALKLFDLETGAARLITDYRTLMTGLPHWVDGDEKIYLYNRGKLEIFESGKKSKKLNKSNKIWFLKNDRLAIGDIVTQKYDILEPIKGERYINITVSPDGLKIAFEIMGGNLYVTNIDGTGLTDLGIGYRPQWAPDSQHLVYMITKDDGHRFTAADIYAIKIDGSEKTRLTFTANKLEMNPSWSPDGKMIAYDVMDEGAIYLIEIDQ